MKELEDWHYRHLTTNVIKKREDILSVSENIDNSFSGRTDIWGLHIFFVESACMIRNAVSQYEQGFIDAAFYSVRTALELARIVTYFSSQNKPLESSIYKAWMHGDKFPFDSRIRTLLVNAASTYNEIRIALSDFFDEQDDRLKRANKYIHKQGYKTFYTQNALRSDLNDLRKRKTDKLFNDFIVNSTVEVAILRLCIDPFPILLQDESIMYKIHFQSITFPFTKNTVKFIGKDKIAKYRNTVFYKSHVERFASNEELCEEAYSIMNDEYYDRCSWAKVKPQLKLLSLNDQIAVLIFNSSEFVSDIYFYGGFAHYFSNVHSNNGIVRGFDSRDLDKVRKAKYKSNVQYHKTFMSYFTYDDTECWVEHNIQLAEKQIEQIYKIIRETVMKVYGPFQK